jgi:xylose isomerase
MIEDARIDTFVKERYASFDSEIGRKIRAGKATLKELSERAVKQGDAPLPGSGRQEYLESVLNEILFS